MAIRASSLSGGRIVPVGGPAGATGQSTYAAWLALGNTGSPTDFMAAQKGKDGVTQDISGLLPRTGDGQGVTLADPSTGAIPRSLLNRALMQPVDAMAFGVKADGSTDDAPALRAAIAAARTRLNRTVLLPAGVICIASTISTPDWSNIALIGASIGIGAGSNVNTQDGTVIKWIGPSGTVTMIDWRSPLAPAPLYLTASSVIRDITFDGNGLAGWAVYARGLYNSKLGIKFRNVLNAGFDLDIGPNGDSQLNVVEYLNGDLNYPASVNAKGFAIGPGSSYQNTHHNTFNNISIVHQAGAAVEVGNADSNVFNRVQAQYPVDGSGTRTGPGLVFMASPNALGPGNVTQAARDNTVIGASIASGTFARAGSFNLPSYGNMLVGFVQGSGEPSPVIEAGARLDWFSSTGDWHLYKIYSGQQAFKSLGDYAVLFQNQSGAAVAYLGTDGILNGVPANSLRARADAGIMLGDGLGVNLWTANGVVRSGYDNGTTLGSPAARWSTTYSVVLNLTGATAPTSSSDASGAVGDVRVAGNAIYWKTASGWLRSVGSTF